MVFYLVAIANEACTSAATILRLYSRLDWRLHPTLHVPCYGSTASLINILPLSENILLYLSERLRRQTSMVNVMTSPIFLASILTFFGPPVRRPGTRSLCYMVSRTSDDCSRRRQTSCINRHVSHHTHVLSTHAVSRYRGSPAAGGYSVVGILHWQVGFFFYYFLTTAS